MQLGRLTPQGRVVRGNADYGFVLNVSAVSGFRPEARISITYAARAVRLADGTTVELREPRYHVDSLNGPALAPDTMLMPRLPPLAQGDGLLEMVPVAELERVARAQAAGADGIRGVLAWVDLNTGNVPPSVVAGAGEEARAGTAAADRADRGAAGGVATDTTAIAGTAVAAGSTANGATLPGTAAAGTAGKGTRPSAAANAAAIAAGASISGPGAPPRMLGRFGWQASEPTVASQVAVAFAREMGLTNPLEAHDDCAPSNAACKDAPSGGTPEVEPALFDAVVNFERWHAVPVPKEPDLTATGAQLFESIGCALCHQTTLAIDASRAIHPFTDLLLHDMGQGLADRTIADAVAASRWRTAPLWGMHAAAVVTSQPQHFLHDGRARTIDEAILWHDGEGRAARYRFAKLTAEQRRALTEWINSL